MSIVRVSAVAKERGVDASALIVRLNALGIYVKSASSTISAAQVRRVFESLDRDPLPPRVNPPRPPRRTRGVPSPWQAPASPPRFDELDLAAAIFGKPRHELKTPRNRRGEPMSKLDDWLREFILPDEKRAWLAVGVYEHELPLVLQWKACGMTPQDLLVAFPKTGATALDYLRGNRPAEQIAEAVRRRKSS